MMASLPDPQKNFQPDFSFSFAIRGCTAARSQTCRRKVAAEARGHGAEPQRDDLRSDPASRLLRGVANLVPAAMERVSGFLRLPADLNLDKVELLRLSLWSGEAASLQSGPPLLLVIKKTKKNPPKVKSSSSPSL